MSVVPEFTRLCRNAPGLYLVMSVPDYTIVDVSEPYCRATLTWREEILGCALFDVFPDNPASPATHGARNLRRSLDVASTGVTDRMCPQHHDMRDQRGDTGWVEKYWLQTNRPVFAANGHEVTHIIHQITDLTEIIRLDAWLDEQQLVNDEQCATVLALGTDLARRGHALATAKQQLRAAMTDHEAIGRANATVKTDLHAPEMRDYLSAGDRTPLAGLYRANHPPSCPSVEHTVVLRAAGPLPPCRSCGDAVMYRLVRHYYNV